MLPSPVPSTVDLQAFGDLRRRAASDDAGALEEAAAQFEALFIGIMLKSARDAKLGDGFFDGDQTRQYLDLMDGQIALELARRGGFGLGKAILEQLRRGADSAEGEAASPASSAVAARPGAFPARLPESLEWLTAGSGAGAYRAARARSAGAGSTAADTPEQFVARYFADAEAAAKKLGIETKLLLAQAALETGWGSATPRHPSGKSTHNMFGIKAGPSWRGERATLWTLESVDGVMQPKRETFRAYPSGKESFEDYVDLVSRNPRYAAALEHAKDPEGYVRALTEAGYATDPEYGAKWLSIYNSERLANAYGALKDAAERPTK